MEINKHIQDSIKKADIPQLLKDYLLRNEQIQLTLSTDLINDIKDLYIEYDSFYEFDKAEFCSYVITGLKKQDKHEYFYNYLKIVMDSNVRAVSKDTTHDSLILERMAQNIKPTANKIPGYIFEVFALIDTYKDSKDTSSLIVASKTIGKLEVLFEIFPGNPYADAFQKSQEKLENLLSINQ